MGYRHINNLYKDKRILMFKEVYAMEKVHGTSAHVSYKNGQLHFHSGGEKYDNFVALFDKEFLTQKFEEIGHQDIVVFGEAYGGKQQAMSDTYGKKLCFIAFEVKIGEKWLSVPRAETIANKLGLEFVPYECVSTDIESLDFERDRPSRVAVRRGILEPKISEGVVLRPLEEVCFNDGDRCIVKYKTDQFSERKSKSDTKVVDAEKLAILTEAREIAEEWVTPMRLDHVLDKLPKNLSMEDIPVVIGAMKEDVLREGSGEFVVNKTVLTEISKKTVDLFTKKLKSQLS